ncbi:MAG: succinate dehydrogenase / fumarate reductase cytochrome b subunit [Salibacteraceae bacterium]|jgi:succinate dehydrogenase / fumarate reductase cytochrome b subunit
MSPLQGFFNSSIARKFWMAITGIFLVTFLVVHLSINLTLFVSAELFNDASHFMATNPVIQVMQYVLAAGFLGHIIMGIKLTLQNKAARPIRYAHENAAASSTWSSRNMIYSGVLVLVFLVIHMRHFFYELKFTDNVTDDYVLVTSIFQVWYYTAFYVLAFIGLGVHLNHGFQSAFQSVGWKNSKWKGLMQTIGTAYSVLMTVGFSSVAIYFFLNPAQ